MVWMPLDSFVEMSIELKNIINDFRVRNRKSAARDEFVMSAKTLTPS